MREKGRRKIRWITDDTVVLQEIVEVRGKKIKKLKLVKLDPANLSWYNIQLAGPNKHSAFLYRIVREGKNRSRLNFTGLLVVYSKGRLTKRKLGEIGRSERQYDANAWRHLAKALYNQTRFGR